MDGIEKTGSKKTGSKKTRIIFMGTPEFAVASLAALIQNSFNVVAVVTAPDKPAGRGMQLQQSAVKKYALEHSIPVLQPEKLKNPAFIEELKSYQADLQVVVAFRMLPEVVWNMPPMGTLNVHGSLLPQYRGAAPINWAVINGEKTTGVTTFKLKHEIDTGDLLMQESFAIGENETAGEVHDRMKAVGANLLVKTIDAILNHSLQPVPQVFPENGIHHAPKIFTETCRIDCTKTVQQVHNHIRGLSPFPGAFTHFDGKVLKVFRSAPAPEVKAPIMPANFLKDGNQQLLLCCADGWLNLLEIQWEGKKKMSTPDFLRGYRLAEKN